MLAAPQILHPEPVEGRRIWGRHLQSRQSLFGSVVVQVLGNSSYSMPLFSAHQMR